MPQLGYVACQFSGNTYVHNDARVLDNGDGTLGWIFTLRNCDGSRKSQQIYYMQSADSRLALILTACAVLAAAALTMRSPNRRPASKDRPRACSLVQP